MIDHDHDWMLIGRVAGVFGLRGEIKIDPLTDFPDRFSRLKDVYLGSSKQCVRLARARAHKNQILAVIDGVDSVESAERLRGLEVFVQRSASVPLPEGHFYLEDVIGISVVTSRGESVGKVADVLRTGSNDVFVVKTAHGETLVPAIRDAVRELNMTARQMVVDDWALEEPA